MVTNATLGERIGVSHSMVSRLLSGDRLPSVPTMARISEYFGRPLAEVVLATRPGVPMPDRTRNWGEYFTRLVDEHNSAEPTEPTEPTEPAESAEPANTAV